MPETWYFDNDFRCVYQEDERGDEETDEVEARIGSSYVAPIIPIDRTTNSSNTGPRKKIKLTLHALKKPPGPPKKSESRVATEDDDSAAEPSSSVNRATAVADIEVSHSENEPRRTVSGKTPRKSVSGNPVVDKSQTKRKKGRKREKTPQEKDEKGGR